MLLSLLGATTTGTEATEHAHSSMQHSSISSPSLFQYWSTQRQSPRYIMTPSSVTFSCFIYYFNVPSSSSPEAIRLWERVDSNVGFSSASVSLMSPECNVFFYHHILCKKKQHGKKKKQYMVIVKRLTQMASQVTYCNILNYQRK